MTASSARRLEASLALAALAGVAALRVGGPGVEAAVDVAVAALVRPAVALDRWGWLEHHAGAVQALGLALGLLGWAAARLGGRAGAVLVGGLLAAPLLGLLGLALGLAPGVLCAGLVALAMLDDSTPGPPSRGLLPAALAGLVAANGLTLLSSGPGDAQTPLELLAWLDGVPAPRLWPWLALGVFVLPSARQASVFPAAVGGIAAAILVQWVVGRDGGAVLGAVPVAFAVVGVALASPRPLRPLVGAVAAGLLGLLHVAATDFLGCDAVRGQPTVQVLSEDAGAFAVQPVPGGVVASFRDRGVLERLGHDGAKVLIDPTDLRLPAWDQQRSQGLLARTAYPEELGRDPQGRVHAFVELPGADTTALLLLDEATGEVLDARQGSGRCFVSSWVWRDGEALAGCEWNGRVLRFAPDEGRWFDPLDVPGGELEELLVDEDGSLLTVGLWSSPWLRRLAADGTEQDRARVGTFAWGLAQGGGSLHVARFHGWQVRHIDGALDRTGASAVGYGVRALAWAPKHGRLLAASGYDGHLYAAASGARTRSLRLGGWLRDVDVEEDGRHAVVGGVCGVLRVDLDAWLSGG